MSNPFLLVPARHVKGSGKWNLPDFLNLFLFGLGWNIRPLALLS